MGKHEKGTPKELANRVKSKGLQKLRWYCEMCQKQCRDANGFKCHLSSEAHQRQLLLVAENTDAYVKQFSREFEENFLFILKNSYGSRRVRANEVYQEIIREKNHVHMTATRWHSLGGFVQHLGSSGQCKVDKTEGEKGWFIQFIDKEEVLRKEEEVRKVKAEKDDEERQQQQIHERAQRALELQGEVIEHRATELIRDNEAEKITLNLGLGGDIKPTPEDLSKPSTSMGRSVFDQQQRSVKKEEPDDSRQRDRQNRHSRDARPRDRSRSRSRSRDRKASSRHEKKKSALDEIREMEERKKERNNRKDYWLHEGIIVKIITKKLGDEFYKTKGEVISLIDEYKAVVKMEDGTKLKMDQNYLETVIPSIGRQMLIVNGAYRGTKAELLSINEKKFTLNLRLACGLAKGREVEVAYEDASKTV